MVTPRYRVFRGILYTEYCAPDVANVKARPGVFFCFKIHLETETGDHHFFLYTCVT